MSSFVLDMQQEIMKPDCDILTVLRKAHLIAAKLNLNEFDVWINHELNGYGDCPRDSIPDYRTARGVLKAFNPYNGWIPAQCQDDELEKMICTQKLHMPISELIDLCKTTQDHVILQFPAGQMSAIANLFDTPVPMQFALHIPISQIVSIIDKTKNMLLEWSIKLESVGITGENMKFNQEEKNMAKDIPQQANYYYGTVINGNVSESQVVSGNNNTSTYNTDEMKAVVDEIRASLQNESIVQDDKESALEILEDISTKLSQNKKPGIIKSAFVGLKDFVLAAGANVTAALITAKIQGLF